MYSVSNSGNRVKNKKVLVSQSCEGLFIRQNKIGVNVQVRMVASAGLPDVQQAASGARGEYDFGATAGWIPVAQGLVLVNK
jgi:hypothetical protein